MAAIKHWTLEELHRLPDDGNKYEVLHGDLFVTPAPSWPHEAALARLAASLSPYVMSNGLGLVWPSTSAVRVRDSELLPDLAVRKTARVGPNEWERLPTPLLVVEVLSPSTRRRDLGSKRDFYLGIGAEEYWVVDPDNRTITSIRRGRADVVATSRLRWHPSGATEPLELDVPFIFSD